MTLVCLECGREIPDDMDFCPSCGAIKRNALRFDEQGRFVNDRCVKCGEVLEPDARFCISCGTPVLMYHHPTPMHMRKNGNIALVAGLIFGFMNIYGIGHLIMRNWSRGFMFLGITAVMMYLDPSLFVSSSLMFTMIRIFIYMYQCTDLLRLVYAPEDK